MAKNKKFTFPWWLEPGRKEVRFDRRPEVREFSGFQG
jgi:hypothetical protein